MLLRTDAEGFRKEVADWRQRVVQLSKSEKPNTKEVQDIAGWLLSASVKIDDYSKMIDEGLKLLLESGSQAHSQSGAIFEKGDTGFAPEKVCLYLWQCINFVAIQSPSVRPELLRIISKLLTTTVSYEVCLSNPTVKNAFISVHNIMAKIFKGTQDKTMDTYILEWMEVILVYHFQRKQNKCIKLVQLFKFSKPQQVLTQETQWIAYLFNQIFSNGKCRENGLSFIELIQKSSKNQQIGFYFLHMVGNFFQDMIDKRVTPQLVSGFDCTIADVKGMYNSKGKCLIELKIGKQDLTWICKRFATTMLSYHNLVQDYIQQQVYSTGGQNIQEVMKSWKAISDYLQQFAHVLNCILFIGGYNNRLQDFVIEHLLQSNTQILGYFEVSYLLYRNIQSTKYQTKVSLMAEMEREAKRKLLVVANIDQNTIETIDVKALKLDRLLANGQLVSILRLLTNLVHINHRAQIPFENDPKYLHMILSLTHDSVSQTTMKQWAIMFIRNVSEWSQKLRDEISAIKVEMKVE